MNSSKEYLNSVWEEHTVQDEGRSYNLHTYLIRHLKGQGLNVKMANIIIQIRRDGKDQINWNNECDISFTLVKFSAC